MYTSAAVPPPPWDYLSPASQLIVKVEENQQEPPPSPADSAKPIPTAAPLPVDTKVQNSSSSSLEDSDSSDGEESLKEVELLLRKGSCCKKPSGTIKYKPIYLPPAEVVVLPRDPGSFWEGLRRQEQVIGTFVKRLDIPLYETESVTGKAPVQIQDLVYVKDCQDLKNAVNSLKTLSKKEIPLREATTTGTCDKSRWQQQEPGLALKIIAWTIDNPTRGDERVDLIVTNVSELIGDISLGCSDHALVEFTVLRDMGEVKSKVRTLDFRKTNFQLFRDIVGSPGRLPLGTREQNRTGTKSSTEHES
ncbi:hypothetical protein BTVI_59767 [Pitangus sulphuratus]|nr:hypothetical protein BTVI_59767 [Pitangus sulphuratus]